MAAYQIRACEVYTISNLDRFLKWIKKNPNNKLAKMGDAIIIDF